MERKLYEHVDGQKATGSNSLTPEESPLLPGPVKMHRQANTLDKDTVSIKNHFDRSDLVNMSSEIELNIDYFDFASINKSNGMIIDGKVNLFVHPNFGEILSDTGGLNTTMMKSTVTNHISLITTHHFIITEFESADFPSFVKLDVANLTTNPLINEDPEQKFQNSSGEAASTASLPTGLSNSTNSSATSRKRFRREEEEEKEGNPVRKKREKAEPLYLDFKHTLKLFERKVLRINVKGTVDFSVKLGKDFMEISVHVELTVGKIEVPVLSAIFTESQLKNRKSIRTGGEWKVRKVTLLKCIQIRRGLGGE